MCKKFGECNERYDVLERVQELRTNMSIYSNGELKRSDDKALYVDWNWINYLEVRLDDNNNVVVEIWVADVKHQWNDLSKVSSMEFVENQEAIYYIKGLDLAVKHCVGAYIKLGDTYGNTLKVADFNQSDVMCDFDKQYYKEFYNTLGGQWKKDHIVNDYCRNGKYLIEEIKNLPLENDNDIISYVEKETRNILNLSLGTTIKVTIPVSDLAEKDANFNSETCTDEIAQALVTYIMEYKDKIEDIK